MIKHLVKSKAKPRSRGVLGQNGRPARSVQVVQIDADSMVTGHREGNEPAAGIVGLSLTRHKMMSQESLSGIVDLPP